MIHFVPRPLAKFLSFDSLLLIVTLHLHNSLPLCLGDILTKYHDLVFGAVVFVELLAQGAFNAQPDLDIILGHKTDGKTTFAGTGSTSNTVDVAGGV